MSVEEKLQTMEALWQSLSADAAAIESALATLRVGLLAGAAIAILLALLASRWVARGVLAPVEEASRAAERIERGDLSARVPVASDDEFGDWAETFNRMAASLEATCLGTGDDLQPDSSLKIARACDRIPSMVTKNCTGVDLAAAFPAASFLAPGRLWFLFGVVLLAAGYVGVQFARRKHVVTFTNVDLLDQIAPKRPADTSLAITELTRARVDTPFRGPSELLAQQS